MQSYRAIIIHPDASGGRCSGTVSLSPTELEFNCEELTYRIPVSQLSVSPGGAGNHFVFLKDKTQNEISIYTSDKSIIKDPFFLSNQELAKDLTHTKKGLNQTLISAFVFLAVIVAIIGGLYLLKDSMIESLASKVPPSWEKSAGDQLFTALSLQYKFVKNDSLKKEFLKAGAPLFKQVEEQGYKIDLYFVDDPTINAFALPGGKVVVQTGLIENAKSWEEVMGVLGHELAHVTRRHHIRGVINNVGIYTILSAFLGDVSALAGTFVNMGGELASLSNSRSFENEADETGWEYLVKADINPSGLISFFETIKKEEKTKLDSAVSEVDLSFLSTHPNIDDRIKHLREKQKESNKKFSPMPDTFAAFRKRLLEIDNKP